MSVMTIAAIFEDGVLKPLHPLPLNNNQKVYLSIVIERIEAYDELNAWFNVLEELTEEEINDIEKITLERSDLSRATP